MEKIFEIDNFLQKKKLNGYDGIALVCLGIGGWFGIIAATGFAYLGWRNR